MSEENIPDEQVHELGLNIISDTSDMADAAGPGTADPAADDDPSTPGANGLDPLNGRGPDDYPGAAENNPDRWRDDPLIQGDAASADYFNSEQYLQDQTAEARYESGEEQIPSEEPTIGEASADVDFGETPMGDEADGSDDDANFGGLGFGR